MESKNFFIVENFFVLEVRHHFVERLLTCILHERKDRFDLFAIYHRKFRTVDPNACHIGIGEFKADVQFPNPEAGELEIKIKFIS